MGIVLPILNIKPVYATVYNTSDDSFMLKYDGNGNYGSFAYWLTSTDGVNAQYWSIARFDLTSLPVGTNITSAIFQTFEYAYGGVNSYIYEIGPSNNYANWTESNVTWNNKPGVTGSPVTLTCQLNKWCNATITTLVQDCFVNEGRKVNFMIEPIAAGTVNQWLTKENVTYKPTLTVTYDASPTYSNNASSTTLINTSCVFSCLWNDDAGLSKYIFGTNNTGTWVNESVTAFSGTPGWANVTKTLTSGIGDYVQYEWWANDTGNNWANTGVLSLTTTALPQYSNIETSTTLALYSCVFSCKWTAGDHALSGYIFGTNVTTSWVNETWAVLGSSPIWANVTKTLSVATTTVQYEWWCNDTANGWTATGIQSVTVTGTYPQYSSALTTIAFYPTDDTYVAKVSGDGSGNYGSETYMLTSEDIGTNYYYASLARFDLSAYSNLNIISAVFSVYCYYRAGTPENSYVYELNQNNWTEGNVTWNNKPSTTGSPVTLTVDLNTWCNATITSIVQDCYFNNSKKVILAMYYISDGGHVNQFLTKENVTYVPRLYITYLTNVGVTGIQAHTTQTFYSDWSDTNGLSGGILGTNITGSLVNETWITLSSATSAWFNTSKALGNHANIVIEYDFYVNSTTGLWNTTGMQYLFLTGLMIFNFVENWQGNLITRGWNYVETWNGVADYLRYNFVENWKGTIGTKLFQFVEQWNGHIDEMIFNFVENWQGNLITRGWNYVETWNGVADYLRYNFVENWGGTMHGRGWNFAEQWGGALHTLGWWFAEQWNGTVTGKDFMFVEQWVSGLDITSDGFLASFGWFGLIAVFLSFPIMAVGGKGRHKYVVFMGLIMFFVGMALLAFFSYMMWTKPYGSTWVGS